MFLIFYLPQQDLRPVLYLLVPLHRNWQLTIRYNVDLRPGRWNLEMCCLNTPQFKKRTRCKRFIIMRLIVCINQFVAYSSTCWRIYKVIWLSLAFPGQFYFSRACSRKNPVVWLYAFLFDIHSCWSWIWWHVIWYTQYQCANNGMIEFGTGN